MAISFRAALAAVLLVPAVVLAQAGTPPAGAPAPASGPAIRRIETASALSKETFGGISSVRQLRDGRVLANDGVRRRLLLLDTTMTVVQVVLDSISEVANSYGTRGGALIPWRGDSTLFIDPASYAVLVLDPAASIARVRSVPRVQDVFYLAGSPVSSPVVGFNTKGRLIYRIGAQAAPPKVAPPAGVPWLPQEPDSAFIIAMDFDSRKVDTLASIHIPKSASIIRQVGEFGFAFFQVINPLPSTDEWAVLPDGTIALVRGRDYRVEYLHPDGTMTSSPKLAFDWQRMTEEDKQKLVDSVKASQRRTLGSSYVAQMIRWVNTYGKTYPAGFTVPEGFTLQQGLQSDWRLPPGVKFPANYIYACAPGVEPTVTPPPPGTPVVNIPGAPPAGTPSCIPAPIMISGGQTPPPPVMRDVMVMSPAELPDYRPPFPTGGVRADADGNLWVRTIPPKPIQGGLVYDIVNRQGELVDRIQTPPGYTLVGFGPGKLVYLSMRDASGIHLARVRLK